MHSGESARVQRGFALIALLSLAALISAFLIASALNFTSAGISNEREERSMGALRKAKAALIAYAASEQWQLYKTPSTYFQPGALPCPDRDDDGDADCIGPTSFSMIGRVPFKTLGIDDLRDASGERLWYALSHDFRKMQCPSANCTTINSDTLGQLTITGMAPATQVVAVVFAPGAALDLRAVGGPQQDRVAGHNDPTNYLENFNLGDNIHFTFTSTGLPTDTSNDRLLVITQADLMAAVEPVVAARVERDIKPYILAWSDPITGWGAYAFAAPFVASGAGPGRAQTDYKGLAGQANGLMPVTTASNWLEWQTSSINVTQIPGGTGTGTSGPPFPSPTIDSIDCGASSASQISCQIRYSDSGACIDRPAIQLQVVLLNAANSFPAPLNYKDAVMTDGAGDPLSFDPNFGNWSPTFPQYNPTTTNVALATGNGQLVFRGRLQNACPPPGGTGGTVTIRISVPPWLAITNNADPAAGWFIANQWYKQVYYAVAPALLPGGSGDCAATPPCLTVTKLPVSYATSNDKRAILVLTGSALNGNPRPSTSPADYLENANLAAALGTTPFVYEHRSGVPTAINDRVVVVSP